jgi:DNA-binding XRE family transcriptional regulator
MTHKKVSSPKVGVTTYKVRTHRTPGETVRSFRKLQFMTQAQLAKASGLSLSIISKIEAGRIPLATPQAFQIAKALLIHPSVILWPNH